jgi:hypothetical protein
MKKTLPALAVLLSSMAATASAQSLENFSVEAGLSTLGLYIAPKADIAPQWQARAPIYLGSLSDTFDADGSEIDGKITSNSVALMADYKIGGAGFRVSGGFSVGGYVLEGSATTLTLDGTDYTGDFTAKLKQKRNVAPVLAVGYARDLGSNWGIMAELGARITSLKLTTTGQENITDAGKRADFDADLAQVNSDLSDIKVLPFITLGVSYKF